MRPPVAVNRWLVQHPVAVDRLLVAGGFVLGAIALVNGAREGVLLLNVLGALLAGGAIAAIFAWSRRRQRGRDGQARLTGLEQRPLITRLRRDGVSHHVVGLGV